MLVVPSPVAAVLSDPLKRLKTRCNCCRLVMNKLEGNGTIQVTKSEISNVLVRDKNIQLFVSLMKRFITITNILILYLDSLGGDG